MTAGHRFLPEGLLDDKPPNVDVSLTTEMFFPKMYPLLPHSNALPALAVLERFQPNSRRSTVIRTMSKQAVVFGVFALWMLLTSGCVNRSEYDAKVTELNAEVAKAQETASELQKELGTAKGQIEKAAQAAKDAEDKVATLEQENADLKEKAQTLTEVEGKVSQLQKDLDDAKARVTKAEQATKNAEARIKTLEKENAGLKDQASKLAEAEQKVSQLQKELEAAKRPVENAK